MILFYFLPSVIELNSIQWLSIYIPYSKSLNIFMSVRLTTYFKWPFLLWNIEGKFTTIAITDFIYLLPILYKMLNYFGNHQEYNKVLYTSVVQSLSLVWLFVTPWTAACQASLSFTISQSLLKLMSVELVMPFNHLILCYPLLCLPSVFLSIRVSSHPMAKYWSFSFSISHPKYIQGWFPFGWTGLNSLLSKGLSRVFSNTTGQKHQFFGAQPSLWSSCHICTWLLEKPSFDYVDICQQIDVSAF